MKRKRVLTLCLLLILCAVLSSCFGGRGRPRDQLVSSVASPDGKLTLNVYRSDGGATVDWSTTVSAADNASGEEWNIYFHYHEYAPTYVGWLDNEHVRINGITLNVYTDYYESFDRESH